MAFIPAFHFEPSEKKLKEEWCADVIQYYVYQSPLTNLLDDKNIPEIDGYADGTYSMKPFKKMFKSLRDQMTKEGNPSIRKEDLDKMDKTGINWERTPLIASKLNPAIATTQKIPLEITCTCIDPLAQKKKAEDLEFLRTRPQQQALMQALYDSMNLGKADVGTTKHSSVPYNSLPLDLDVNDEQEFLLFANIIYNLAPAVAFETILQLYIDTRKIPNIRLMETRDQYKYAVSVHQVMTEKITGFPIPSYIYPGSVLTDGSMLPDFTDNTVRLINRRVTPMELFKYFPDEICDEKQLEAIIGTQGEKFGWGAGYCACNGKATKIERSDWNTFKMSLAYVEIKSVDSAMYTKSADGKNEYFTNDPQKCTGRVWAQNTYCFYWLWNTKWFFGIDKLPWSKREKGNEKYQQFSTNIYKSQEKSAVELSIGENKKAQMADVKLQHNVVMSLPPGKVIDLKYLRSALEGLTEDGNKYTLEDLLIKAMEFNVHIIDTQGFENRREGQLVPVRELPGGLRAEIEGYYRVILEADQKISQYTNIYPQLTGQGPNPEGLVGLEKLLINSSLNGLYYVNEALVHQYTGMFTLIAADLKVAIDKGGKVREALVAIIGSNKVEIIDNMDAMSVHDIGVVVKLGQREEERAAFRMELENMRREGKIDSAAKYYIFQIPNPKEAFFVAAMFERKFRRRQEAMQIAQMQQQQKVVEQQGQNQQALEQQKMQGEIVMKQQDHKNEAELMVLANKLGLTQKQIDGLIKRQLQDDRLRGQIEKSLRTLQTKDNLEKSQPLPA